MRIARLVPLLFAVLYGTPHHCFARGDESLPEAILREVRDRAMLPQGAYTLVRRWSVVNGASHMTGRAVADAGASGGCAWEALPGKALAGRAMVFGPYLDVPSGDYVALVRVKAMDDLGAERICELDAVVAFGQSVCTSRELTGLDLPVGRYVQVPLAFGCPGGKLEVRVHWTGYAGLRVDTVHLYRVTGAAPLPGRLRAAEPRPSGRPNNLDPPSLKRPYPDPLPRSAPPADTLWVCDISRELPDVQLAVLVLQGLVNRKRPVLYCLYAETDATWLNWMRRNGWVKQTRRVPSWTALLRTFRSSISGAIVTDPALPATKNVANMVAAAQGGIVVSPRLLRTVPMLRSFPVKVDLRGRWRTNAEAYRWALDNLWSKLNPHLAACSYPDHLGLRDYLTQHKAFIFWVSGPIDGARPYANPDEEVRLAEEILARMPANSPIMSYPWAGKEIGMGEGPGVTLFAEFGKYLVGSIDCTNLSVHSGIRVSHLRPRNVPPPRLDPSRVYLSFIMSDGDNLPVLTLNNFPQLWRSPDRGKVPIGWTVSPAASILIPDVVSYYYATATSNDAFLGAVSGLGYTYPDSYGLRYKPEHQQAVFDGFLTDTGTYLQRLGVRSVWIMNATRPERIRRYAEKIPFLEALFPDYGRRVADYGSATYPTARNVPVFHAVTGWTENATREEKISQMVEQIRNITPSERPAFLHVFLWNWGADLSIYPEVLKRLGPAYVAVRPDHLSHLFQQDFGRRKLLARLPERIVAVEGLPTRLTGTFYASSTEPVTVQLSATDALKDAMFEPSQLTVAAGTGAQFSLTGRPQTDQIAIVAQAPFGTRRYSVSVRLVSAQELTGARLPSGTLCFAGIYEAENLAHNSGTLLSDVAASGSSAWKADEATAKPGYVVYGPYAPIPAGRYLALFRLKGSSGNAAVLDTCVGGGNPITAQKTVGTAELDEQQYRCLALEFHHPGGPLETRLRWSGRGWVALDWVAVWQIEE